MIDAWLDALRARQPGASLGRILGWYACHAVSWLWMTLAHGYRAYGVRNIPRSGPLLIVANHQSYLDPILVGLGGHRRQFHAMARSTLFKGPLAPLIRFLNALPIDRGESDLAAMRRAIDLLRSGQALLVFPEGTRCHDGVTAPFAPGLTLLIRRAMPTVIPVAIDGAFHAWPRGRKLPLPGPRIAVHFGKPIPARDLIAMSPEAGINRLHDEVEALRQQLAQRLRHPERPSRRRGGLFHDC